LTAEAGGTFFFRLTALDPSHPAPLADVRDQVVKDLQTQQAWDMAKKDADQFLTDARQSGMLTARNQSVRAPSPMVTTGLFMLGHDANTEDFIPRYGVSGDSGMLIKQAAVQALTDKAAGKPPIEEVPLPDQQKVAIIELTQSFPTWSNDQDKIDEEYSDLGLQELPLLLQAEWAKYDDLLARMKFKLAPKS